MALLLDKLAVAETPGREAVYLKPVKAEGFRGSTV